MANDFLTLIKTRRSIRAYKPDAVPADVLARVLEAGTYAPSAMGKQSATIVAVTTQAYRDRLTKLNAAGQTAAVAREDKAGALGVTHICDRGLPAHEDDVRVAQLAGDGFGHVETVAGARVAEDHIFAHVKHSLKF